MTTGLSYKKKGNTAIETVTVVVFIVLFALTTVVVYSSLSDVFTELSNDTTLSNTTRNTISLVDTTYQSVFDYAIIFMYFILAIGSAIAAYFVEANPRYFVVLLIALVIVTIIGAYLNNAFFDVVDNSLRVTFPYTFFIMDHIVMFSIIFGVLITLGLYAHP